MIFGLEMQMTMVYMNRCFTETMSDIGLEMQMLCYHGLHEQW